jgi:hypothetical protein
MFDPMKHIKLGKGNIFIDDGVVKMLGKIDAQVVDMNDDFILKAVVEAAKEVGITDLYLLDKTFVVDALKRAAGRGRWVPNGIYDSMLSMCSVCGFPAGAYSFNFCPHCGTRMDGENHG